MSLSWQEYQKLEGVNWSNLKHMAKSPAHYRQNLMTPREDTPSLKLGRCTHMAVLEPEQFVRGVAVWDGGTRRGKAWDAFQEANKGRELLTVDEHAQCVAVAAAVRNHPVAGKYVAGGKSEVAIQWKHEEPALGDTSALSIQCKGRMDFISKLGAIVDLKTCRDASGEGFGRTAWNFKYTTQAAWYADGYARATGQQLPVALVAVETAPPYALVVYRIPEIVLDVGREEYRALLRRLDECRTENDWPGYAADEMELTLPKWAVNFSDDEDATGMDLVFHQQEA